jgi:hypothetical protein
MLKLPHSPEVATRSKPQHSPVVAGSMCAWDRAAWPELQLQLNLRSAAGPGPVAQAAACALGGCMLVGCRQGRGSHRCAWWPSVQGVVQDAGYQLAYSAMHLPLGQLVQAARCVATSGLAEGSWGVSGLLAGCAGSPPPPPCHCLAGCCWLGPRSHGMHCRSGTVAVQQGRPPQAVAVVSLLQKWCVRMVGWTYQSCLAPMCRQQSRQQGYDCATVGRPAEAHPQHNSPL